jgi:DNA-binding response OmpR family regulator
MTHNAAILNDKRILIIEDDQDIAQLLLLHLSDIYRTVKAVHNGRAGFEEGLKHSWDIILLDIRLPDMDGLEICKQLRTHNILTPILMLTSKSSELDQVLGFEIGADDYVTKPFRLLELSARIKALLRRNSINKLIDDSENQQHIIRCGKLELDIEKRKATISGEIIELTVREFKLLIHFAKSPGRVYSRMELLDSVWGISHQGYEHTVNSHINRLRNKMSAVLKGKHCIETVWGIGYKLSEEF